jgi:hypothetical protein
MSKDEHSQDVTTLLCENDALQILACFTCFVCFFLINYSLHFY